MSYLSILYVVFFFDDAPEARPPNYCKGLLECDLDTDAMAASVLRQFCNSSTTSKDPFKAALTFPIPDRLLSSCPLPTSPQTRSTPSAVRVASSWSQIKQYFCKVKSVSHIEPPRCCMVRGDRVRNDYNCNFCSSLHVLSAFTHVSICSLVSFFNLPNPSTFFCLGNQYN